MERSLTGLVRPYVRECGEGSPRCRERPTGGYNPLGFCACHLALYCETIRTNGAAAVGSLREHDRPWHVPRPGQQPTPPGDLEPACSLVIYDGGTGERLPLLIPTSPR